MSERDLMSQTKATDGKGRRRSRCVISRPDCPPREALVTVLTLRGEDVFRAPAGHVVGEDASRADGNRGRCDPMSTPCPHAPDSAQLWTGQPCVRGNEPRK